MIITIISVFAPIVLTIINIRLTKQIDKQNTELQKKLSNRDTLIQTREIFFHDIQCIFRWFLLCVPR